jgi:hypothetical protein
MGWDGGALPGEVDGPARRLAHRKKLDFTSEFSMAKHFVANALNRIIDRAIQVHGALRALGAARGRGGRGAPDADRATGDRGVQEGREDARGDG